MARTYNGTSQGHTAAVDLSGTATLSLSFWLYWDAFSSNDDLAFEYSPVWDGGNNAFIVDMNYSGTATIAFGFTKSGPQYWFSSIPRPSAAAWHHYILSMNRSSPANTAFVDGVSQTITTINHTSATYGNFGNHTLYIMSRNSTSLFGAGRMANLGIYNAILNQQEASELAAGFSCSVVRPDALLSHYRFQDSDGDVDWWGQANATAVGSPTYSQHPPLIYPSGVQVITKAPAAGSVKTSWWAWNTYAGGGIA